MYVLGAFEMKKTCVSHYFFIFLGRFARSLALSAGSGH